MPLRYGVFSRLILLKFQRKIENMDKEQEKFNKGEIIIYQPKTGGPKLEERYNQLSGNSR
jgi:hypothetical protein